MHFLREAKKRWGKESPAFFKRLRKFGIWLTASAGTLAGIGSIPGVEIASWIPVIAGYMAALGAGATIVSNLPVYDTEDLKDDKG